MLKIIILTVIISVSMFAATETFYELGSYEDTFVKEVGKEKAKNEIKKTMQDKNFKKAYDLLNVKIKKNKDNNINHPDYKKVLEYLKKSDKLYANWTGLILYVLTRTQYDKKYAKDYGIYFAKKTASKNLCNGYLMYGAIAGKLGYSKKEQFDIWSKGLRNKCTGTYFEKFYLKARKRNAKIN